MHQGLGVMTIRSSVLNRSIIGDAETVEVIETWLRGLEMIISTDTYNEASTYQPL